MEPFTAGSLFSGIGGLDLGLERAGMEVRWQCEVDPFCRSILRRHWPHVRLHGDCRSVDWATVERVDLVCGGFPCQPVSDAGQQRAQSDDRWLWPAMAEALAALRPTWVVVENVSGLRTRGLDIVRDGLAELGYLSRVVPLSACELGAPHTRRRLFVIAHASGLGCRAGRLARPTGASWSQRSPSQRRRGWTHEPRMGRVAYGLPSRVDRIRALGNAVVPEMAEAIGRRIMAVD